MRKGLIFFLGIVTGCVLTIAVLFVIGITNSNANESDITIAEQQTVFTTATKFEVFQVLGDGALANCEEKGHSTSFFTGPVVYIVTDGQNLFYDTVLSFKTIPIILVILRKTIIFAHSDA